MDTSMNIPPKCPYCGNWSQKVTGEKIYPHRPDLYGKKFYLCEPCDAYVGCHSDGKPMGRLANLRLRQLKSMAHAVFDPLWKSKALSRTKAYAWMATRMDLEIHHCHIGHFDEDQCLSVIFIINSDREAGKYPFDKIT